MLRFLLFLALVLTGAGAWAQPAATADALIEEGLTLYAADQNAEALDRFQRALKLRPDDFRAQYGVALVYYTTGRYAESAALCAQLVKRGDDHLPNLYVTYGTSLDRQHKSAEAVEVYQQALRKFPADEPLWRYQGVALLSLKRYDEAAASLQQALRLRPDKATSHLLLAQAEASRQHRVPALLAALYGLTLSTSRSQAAPALELLDKLLQAGVQKNGVKDGVTNVSVTLGRQGDQPAARPDNFAFTETSLTLAAAADFTKENEHKTPAERLSEKLDMLGSSLAEQPAAARQGFSWEHYAPFFMELHQQGHATALAYLLEAMRPGTPLPDVSGWLRTHPQQLQNFANWRKAYQWPVAPADR